MYVVEWISTYWPALAGCSIFMLWMGRVWQLGEDTRSIARANEKTLMEMNGSVKGIAQSQASCQAIQARCPWSQPHPPPPPPES